MSFDWHPGLFALFPFSSYPLLRARNLTVVRAEDSELAIQQNRKIFGVSGRGHAARRLRWCAAGFVLAVVVGWQGLTTGAAAAQEQSTWSGVYTDAQASRGESVYNLTCAVCHGDDLAGGEMGPGLAGSSFLNFWDGLSLGDLYMVMSVSMPQDNPGSLDPAQYVDVIAYMLQQSEFPTGDGDLSEGALGDVTIQAQAQ